VLPPNPLFFLCRIFLSKYALYLGIFDNLRSKLNKGNFNKSSSPSETIKRYMSNEQLHTDNLIETVQVVVDFSMRGWGKTVFIVKYVYLR